MEGGDGDGVNGDRNELRFHYYYAKMAIYYAWQFCQPALRCVNDH